MFRHFEKIVMGGTPIRARARSECRLPCRPSMNASVEMAAAGAATVCGKAFAWRAQGPANAEFVFMGGREEPGHDDLLGMCELRSP